MRENHMSSCHHIDYGGLQINIDVRNGRESPVYTCILCEKIFDEKQYTEVIKEIKKQRENHTLTFYKTPNGKTHTEEDCVDKKRCNIHEEDKF